MSNIEFRQAFAAWADALAMNKKQLRHHAAKTFGKTPGWYDSRERGQTLATYEDVEFILQCAESDTTPPLSHTPKQFVCADCEGFANGEPAVIIPSNRDGYVDTMLCNEHAGTIPQGWTPFPDYSAIIEKLATSEEITVGGAKIPVEG